MRKFLLLLTLAFLLISITACAASKEPVPPTTARPSAPTQSVPVPTVPPTTEEAVPTSETQVMTLPYTVTIPRPDFSIWSGPSYDHSFVDTVRVPTLYTIVQEASDAEGNLWGLLKSGLGWVDLTLLEQEAVQPPVVSVNFTTPEQLQDKNNLFYTDGTSDDRFTVYVYEPVTDMTLCPVSYNEALIYEEPLFSQDSWSPDQAFVVQAPFPGDMSMYALRFTDSAGAAHTYLISISGRNGTFYIAPEF